jgi:hypothetical protein
MPDSTSNVTDQNNATSQESLSFWALCLLVWNSLTSEQIEAWENYAANLDDSLSAFVVFMLVAAADKPTQPKQTPPQG